MPNANTSRHQIIERIKLGWMVLDSDNRIEDANPFIEIITGQPLKKLRGRYAQEILVNQEILEQESKKSEYSFIARVNFDGFIYIFDVRSLPMLKENGDIGGRLLLWQDITEHKKSEQAHQQSLSNRINLMRSISTAANHITDIHVFLETAIFQIVASFNGLAGFVFTRDSDFIGDEKAGFRLRALYSYNETLGTNPVTTNLLQYLGELSAKSKCVQVKNISPANILGSADWTLPDVDLLLCPIVVDEYLQGALCIIKSGGPSLSADDSTGLEMIANELSMLIYVDHQRREAVTFSERRKLVRDLHDTVTQQLYGLLYQVEITQASLELNQTDKLPESLNKIGKSARQALREMRLFLHELQPLDLKKEGIIGALHSRLTAVEGQANIHAHLIAPESLDISFQQELILYQIAREALNNILRHAKANQIAVLIKEDSRKISFEITDDGEGFEKSRLKKAAGMGVKNIKEWAAQIQAKLQIQSSPGKGTRIKVVMPKNA